MKGTNQDRARGSIIKAEVEILKALTLIQTMELNRQEAESFMNKANALYCSAVRLSDAAYKRTKEGA